MSQAGSQYAAFWQDVKKTRKVWTVEDKDGFPAPMTGSGQRAMPFWSSLARVRRIIKTVPAYAGFTPCEMSWETFRDKWLLQLEESNTLVGVNWSGARAVGHDLTASDIRIAGAAIVDGKGWPAPPPAPLSRRLKLMAVVILRASALTALAGAVITLAIWLQMSSQLRPVFQLATWFGVSCALAFLPSLAMAYRMGKDIGDPGETE